MGLQELFFSVVLPLTLAGGAFWIWMLVECATREPSVGNDKVVLILILLFTGFIGALIYFFVRRPKHAAEAWNRGQRVRLS